MDGNARNDLLGLRQKITDSEPGGGTDLRDVIAARAHGTFIHEDDVARSGSSSSRRV
ncbi:hypothetical protein JDV09_10980 [Mycobacterium sp. Y57]|uniref:hypothetical protein n=1 Tax=Mycolicibacterium xanthum TaxID=2796469 RepID=UPI001C85DC9E|nr:hypothetical protein [Mycolicibacterium xanthum]MBX7432623.1 hypothetical protein [Mycolicibacterium xanthum]